MTSNTPVAPGARLQKVADGFRFTEGPTSDLVGNIYFTDQPNDRILRFGIDGRLTTFLSPCGRSNGLCFDGADAIVACADERNELWAIDIETKAVTVLVTEYAGKLLNGPNDVWVHPAGYIYFSDPFYQRDYWSRGPMEQDGQHVYLLSPDGTLSRVIDDLEKPNGLVGTPDGQALYVADIGAGKTYRYRIEDDRRLTARHLVCNQGSDGVTIDVEGNLYLTGGEGVTIVGPDGGIIDRVAVPGQKWTSNLCFGGADNRTLFITAGTGLFALEMRVEGARFGAKRSWSARGESASMR